MSSFSFLPFEKAETSETPSMTCTVSIISIMITKMKDNVHICLHLWEEEEESEVEVIQARTLHTKPVW